MKNKDTYDEAPINSAVAAEIEALNMEVADLKKALRLTTETLSDAIYALRGFREQRLLDANNLIK